MWKKWTSKYTQTVIDGDGAATPPVKKARLGAKFNSQWIKELPFISNAMNDPYRFVVIIIMIIKRIKYSLMKYKHNEAK